MSDVQEVCVDSEVITAPEIAVAADPSAAPIALVNGEPVVNLPKDLYIPPEALEIFLEAFEGPLDLLLYLIKHQNLDVLDIPIAEITRQYMEYVEIMKELHLELAAEYLVMAAMLAEIKSRMLLPRPITEDGEEEDPRAELIRRLQEYEQIKQVAQEIDALPRQGRDTFPVYAEMAKTDKPRPLPQPELRELLLAFQDVMQRVKMYSKHKISQEPLSIRERMSQILVRAQEDKFLEFTKLFTIEEGRMGVVVSFIAILELLKQSMIEIVQAEPFSPIHIRMVTK